MPVRRDTTGLDCTVVEDPPPRAILVLIVAVSKFVRSDESPIEQSREQRSPSGAAPPHKEHQKPLFHPPSHTESRANIEARAYFPSHGARRFAYPQTAHKNNCLVNEKYFGPFASP